jgi:hypothetical protein
MKKFKEYIKEVKKPTGELKDACWKGYTAVGMKMKGGRKVPNCVPEEVEIQENHIAIAMGKMLDDEGSMILNQLDDIDRCSKMIREYIGKDYEKQVPAWVQSKVTLAADYINTVGTYLSSKNEDVNESVEQIDEISKETLTSYRDKAKATANKMAAKHHEIVKKDMATGDFTASKKSHSKIAKLDKGYLKAGQKLAKKASDEYHSATQGPKKPSNQFKTPPQGYKAPGSDRPYWGEDVEQVDEVAAWQRKEGKNPSGGLNRKGVMSYRREHPGSTLKTAVTTKPSKLKPGSKAANRRKSFCARMSGMKKRLTSAKTAHDPNSRINKSLRKWNC